MKRKYEVETKVPGVTIQAEESACPDTITLSVIADRNEVLALCLSREAWQELARVGVAPYYSFANTGPEFDWAPALSETEEKANG